MNTVSLLRLRARPMNVLELSRLHLVLLGATALAAALACILASHLIWNATPSMPLGLYWLSPGAPPDKGLLVAFPIPPSVRALVAARHYLPARALLLKRVVASEGDEVCAQGGVLSIEGAPLGAILTEDSAGRPLPRYDGCGPLPAGLLFVASPHPKSFDSRTFGPIPTAAVRGTVTPLWTF